MGKQPAPACDGPLDMFVGDDTIEVPTNNELSEISRLAARQVALEKSIALMNDDLSQLNEELRNLTESLLPDAMAAVGMQKFTLEDGNNLTIKDEVFAAIRAEQTKGAVRWLEKQGLGDVVKDELKITLGRGETKLAPQFLKLADKLGVNATEKESIHASTLKALVKEQLAKGVQFPEEYFSIKEFKKSVIKAPKVR